MFLMCNCTPIKETLSQCKTNTEMLEPLKTEKFDVSPASLAFVQDESLLWYRAISQIRTEIENFQGDIYIPELVSVA